MKRWDLLSLPPSTEKEHPREPHPDAPRVPTRGQRIPRVLFSAPECRAVVVELEQGGSMGDHHVRERAVVHVVCGRVGVQVGEETVECSAGTVLTFDPSERHSVHALEDAKLLLILAPWPAAAHYTDAETANAQDLPRNARVAPSGEPSAA